MGVGTGLYMYDVVVEKFTLAISSPDEFLFQKHKYDLITPSLDLTNLPQNLHIHPKQNITTCSFAFLNRIH